MRFALSVLLVAVLTGQARADDAELRRELEAARAANAEQRWADQEAAFERARQASFRVGEVTPGTARIAGLVDAEVRVHRLRVALEGMSGEAVDLRPLLGSGLERLPPRLEEQDAEGTKLIQLQRRLEGEVAVALASHLERRLAGARKALAAGRVHHFEYLMGHFWDTQLLELDPVARARRASLEKQRTRLGDLHNLDRGIQVLDGELDAPGEERSWTRIGDLDRLRAGVSQASDLPDVERWLQERLARVEVKAAALTVARAEELFAASPEGSWPRRGAGSTRQVVAFVGTGEIETALRVIVGCLPALDRGGAETAPIAARIRRLLAAVAAYRDRPACVDQALERWLDTQAAHRGWDSDVGRARAMALAAGTWRTDARTEEALTVDRSGALSAAVSRARLVRDEAAARWLDAVGARLGDWERAGSDDAALVTLVAELEAFAGFEGQPDVLARARSLVARDQQRRRWTVALAWGVVVVVLVVLTVLAGLLPEATPQGRPLTHGAAIGQSIAALLLWVGLGQLLLPMLAVGGFAMAEQPAPGLRQAVWIVLVTSVSVSVGLALALRAGRRLPPVSPAGPGASIGWAVLASAVMWLGALAVTWLQEVVGYPVEEGAALRDVLRTPSVALCVAVSLCPAIGEELLFRRVVCATLSQSWGAGAGVLVSSLAFSACHLNPSGFLVLAVVGAGLGLAQERTGRIVVPIVLHAVYNLVAVTAAVLG